MRNYLIIGLFTLLSSGLFGQVDLAIQKGHSSSISQLEFSSDSKLLLSLGQNNEGIVWDIKLRKALTNFKLPDNLHISGVKFVDGDKKIKLQSISDTYLFDLNTDKMEKKVYDGDTIFRKKDFYEDPNNIHVVTIKKGALRKGKKNKRFAKYWVSVGYTRADFLAFDVSLENNLIVGVAENNAIYCNGYKRGKKIELLQGHNAPAYDVRFSPDGKYFATAGEDRSIIIWDAKTFEEHARLFSNIFRKNTAVFSHNGNQIHIGDELGLLYSVDFDAIFPATHVQTYPQPINKIVKSEFEGKPAYFVCNSNNSLEIKYNLNDEEPAKRIRFRRFELSQAKDLLLQNLFGTYRDPIGEVKQCDISPDKKSVLLTGTSDASNITFAKFEKRRAKHLYAYYEDRPWKDVKFLSNTSFVSVLENSGSLYFWRSEKRKFYFKTDSLPFNIDDIVVLDSNTLWLNSTEEGQFTYNIANKSYKKVSSVKGNSLFAQRDYIIICDPNHELVFFNRRSFKEEVRFKGHTDRVTGVDFHPSKNIFISSSDDGTMKLWNYSEHKMIASLIPFKDSELIIITAENYYLVSKGAFDEIGFKYNGQFFYPDQFDLKFNRPDIVLTELGYSNPDLIAAYYRAYQKRLKKLNFTEEALSGSFHLPTLTVDNKGSIPSITDNKTLELKLNMKDSEDLLDSYKIWVNDVAVLGSSGVSVRNLNTSELVQKVPISLGYGNNKIEVSVLNQSGAESYKEALNVYCNSGKEKPDAYIVSIGVSKYKDSKYNLAYAAKDARDIENLFNKNSYFKSVSTKSFRDEDAVLESLTEITAFLSQADVDDLVLIFVAGHGVLDNDFNYYFASHDMDFSNPAGRGILYEKIESLLDGIKALKKLLILDTCHSGEIDKDEVEITDTLKNADPGEWNFRSAGVNVALKEDPLGFANINNLMKLLFLDLRKGTGATVISSSGGAELAFESPKYENGLFTYSLIDALSNKKADLNKDKVITLSELQQYVTEEVRQLSNGLQVPTSRIQNKELDYQLW